MTSYVLERGRFAVETSTGEQILLKIGALNFGFPLAAYETAEINEMCEGAKLYAAMGQAVAEFFLAQIHLELTLGMDDDVAARRAIAAKHGLDQTVMTWIRAHRQSLCILRRCLAVAAGLACVPEARARLEEADTLEFTAELLRDTQDYTAHYNGIGLLVELYYRGDAWRNSATGRNSFTRRAVQAGLFGAVLRSMLQHRTDEALQASATRLLICFHMRGEHGPRIWMAARDAGAVHHLVRLAHQYAPTDADSVLALDQLEISDGPAGRGENGRQATLHSLAMALLSALTHVAEPGAAVEADMHAPERARREQAAEDGLADQLLQQGHFAALRYACNFGEGQQQMSPARISESFHNWNRRLEGGEASQLRFLLAGVPPLSEWVADGVDVSGESQQLAGTIVVGIHEGS